MTVVVERVGHKIERSLAPLALNQQQMEDTLAHLKKKELKRKDLDNHVLAKLKVYAHKKDTKDPQAF